MYALNPSNPVFRNVKCLAKLFNKLLRCCIGMDEAELELLKYQSNHQALQIKVKEFTQTTPCLFLDSKAESCEDRWQQLSQLVIQAR